MLYRNVCRYFEAYIIDDAFIKGKELTRTQALNRLRSGESVWVNSRKGARSLAKSIGVKGAAMRHVNHGTGYLKHFHDGIHAFSGHVFYGVPVF